MDWTCTGCTFINTDTPKCECCGAQKPAVADERPAKKPRVSHSEQQEADLILVDSDIDCDGCRKEPTAPAQPGQQLQPSGNRLQGPDTGPSGLYLLDNCCCRTQSDDLTQHLLQQLEQHVLDASTDNQAAVAALSCPRCSKAVSSQDLYKLLGGVHLGRAYAALAAKVKQRYEQLNPPASPAGPPCCSGCPQGTLVLATSSLRDYSTKGRNSSNKQQASPSKHLLHSALQARHLNSPRSAANSAAVLAEHLGPHCDYFCTQCAAAWFKPSNNTSATRSEAAVVAVDTVHNTGNSEAAAAVDTALRLWKQLVQLQQVMTHGAPAAAAVTSDQSSSKAKNSEANSHQPQGRGRGRYTPRGRGGYGRYGRGSSYNYAGGSAWAAGTGYGGGYDYNTSIQQALTAAEKKQKGVDDIIKGHLDSICSILTDKPNSSRHVGAPSSSSSAAANGGSHGSSAVVDVAACAVLLGGPLAWLLRLLFSNDSLMDVSGRKELYRSAMKLLRCVGSSPDLLPLLSLPADDPRDSSTNTNTTSSTACTLLSVLQRLQQQANIFRKSAADLMDGDDADDADGDYGDTTAAVCLALDVSDLVQNVVDAHELFSSTLVAEKGQLQLQPVSAAAGDDRKDRTAAAAAGGSAAAGGRAGASGSSSRQRQGTAADVAGSNATAAAAAAAEAQYVSALQPYQFSEVELLKKGSYYFRNAAEKQQATGGEVMRKRLRRITEELGALSTGLPLSADSSILVACDSERMDVLRALLLPHPDTPYGGGAFLFDILLPPEYPNKPPLVQFLTTGGGRVRFNPNLYDCGKVCLSLLGTWSGPSWEPGVSTLLQVLISLQSMVFVPDPYYNEPGYERYASTPQGKQQALEYNQNIRLQTARYAILEALKKPDGVFRDAIKLHFSLRGGAVLDQLQKWVGEAGKEKKQLKEVLEEIRVELSRLPKPNPTAAHHTAGVVPGNDAREQQQQQQHHHQQLSVDRQQQQPQSLTRRSDRSGNGGLQAQVTDVQHSDSESDSEAFIDLT